MERILDWGIEVVLWFQQAIPTLNLPFKFFSFLGTEEFILIMIPLVYWCLDRRTGARLTVIFLVCAYTNSVAKFLGGQPRPYMYDSQVQQLDLDATNEGFPSGHTSSTVVLWGYLASQFRRRWLWVLAALLFVMVPLSRIYLGVHFPHDLLGGYVLGAVLLLLYLWLQPGGEKWLADQSISWQLATAIVIPALMMLVFLQEDGVTDGATLMGMGVGFILERRWVRFDSGGVGWKRVVRYLVGIIVIVGLWAGLRVVFDGLEPALLFRFIRYTLVGLWGAVGGPWVFVKLGLAEAKRQPA